MNTAWRIVLLLVLAVGLMAIMTRCATACTPCRAYEANSTCLVHEIVSTSNLREASAPCREPVDMSSVAPSRRLNTRLARIPVISLTMPEAIPIAMRCALPRIAHPNFDGRLQSVKDGLTLEVETLVI